MSANMFLHQDFEHQENSTLTSNNTSQNSTNPFPKPNNAIENLTESVKELNDPVLVSTQNVPRSCNVTNPVQKSSDPVQTLSDTIQKQNDPIQSLRDEVRKPNDSHSQKTNESRIPVPASPILLRRHNSLRLKGEIFYKDSALSNRRSSGLHQFQNLRREEATEKDGNENKGNKSTDPNQRQGAFLADLQEFSWQSVSVARPPLKRGQSLMESGEKRGSGNGGKHCNGGSSRLSTPNTPVRPQSVKICGKAASPGVRLANSPQSPARLRSLSLSLSNTRINSPKSPKIVTSSPYHLLSPDTRNHFSSATLDCCWDTESVTSIGSSVASCEHAAIARNGTTFSGRSMKYVFHCNQHAAAAGDEYLTPTQRAHRQVKKLKYLLHQAKKDLEQKDSDILKLTREVVELRLYKTALNSPEDKSQSNSSDAVTVKENASEEASPERDLVDSSSHAQCNNSFTDSGHFEDGTNSSVHSKDSFFDDSRSPFKSKTVETSDKSVTAQIDGINFYHHGSEKSKLIVEYEKRIQELVKMHEDETHHLKQKHNDKVEELLQRITEINSRYWELVPELETGKERIKELEQQLEEASKKLEEQEDNAKKTYLKMYAQGQEAARQERENSVMELARQHPNRVSVPELLQELQVTKNELENIKDVEYASTSKNSQPLLSAKEALSLWVLGARKAMYRQLMEAKSKNKIDPEITLQFLKSAVYYFLTDKENSQGHLKAIESILGFTSNEISNIDKARFS